MTTMMASPLLWRVLGGFAFGTILTLGLGALGDAPPPPTGVQMELAS